MSAVGLAAQGTDHPEAHCQRCERANVRSWYADSPIWNAAIRRTDGSDEWNVLCPVCFVEVAVEKGVANPDRMVWHLSLNRAGARVPGSVRPS